ncbi:MAG: helix-turn-helix transcriptional regulator [Pseudomonadota bacterium]|nr:MAG: helix-turn-helix transcriptional regulator [Pseudomonadota bacterium]
MVKYSTEPLDATFAALADPTRRSILSRLAESTLSMGELAEPYAMSLAAVSKHVRVLAGAGLVAQDRLGRVRRCRITPGPLRDAADWIAEYQQFWDDRLDALADYLEETTGEDTHGYRRTNHRRKP